MMIRSLILLTCAALALTACNKRKDAVLFEGLYFPAKTQRVSKEARDHFTVSVKDANQNLNAAREAGRYEGIKYCINEYGTSKIDWAVGPETETIIPVDSEIQFQGVCNPW